MSPRMNRRQVDDQVIVIMDRITILRPAACISDLSIVHHSAWSQHSEACGYIPVLASGSAPLSPWRRGPGGGRGHHIFQGRAWDVSSLFLPPTHPPKLSLSSQDIRDAAPSYRGSRRSLASGR